MGDAGGAKQLVGLALLPVEGRQRLLETGQHPGHQRRSYARQQHHELVPAKPGEDIRIAKHPGEQQCHLAQGIIPHLVSQGVVNLLETVEVEEQQTRLPPLPMGELQALLPQHDEATTVGDAGQLVQDSQLNGGQLMLHHARQIHQQGPLTLIQLARPAIDKAEGTVTVHPDGIDRKK